MIAIILFISGIAYGRGGGLLLLLGIAFVPLAIVGLFGLMAIAPNDSRVLLLFGEHKGTVKESGFFWVNPFYSKRKVSLRVRNFETGSSSTPEQKNQHGA